MIVFVSWMLFGFIICVISMFDCKEEWEDTTTLGQLFWHTIILSIFWPILLIEMIKMRIGFLSRPRKFWFHKKG